jgi:hypothetical protein
MTILLQLNKGDYVYNDITNYQFYLWMALPITSNNKQICNVTFVDVISEVVVS